MVSKLTYNDTIKRFVIVIGLLGGVFILSMALMVTLLSKILSEGILRPLEELNFATERISSGDLNFSLSYKDDNEMGRVCQQFETMRDKLKESLETQNHYERSRKELIASITHDLKTPLTSIKGYVEGLQDGLVKDKITYDRYLNVIHSKAEKLNYLIDDLFIFSQLELNKFAVNPEPLDISEVLDRYFDYKELDIKNQNINLILEEPFVKEIILLDEFRIGQVLENLVQNALKFTKSYIRVSTKITDDKYIIMIEDDGIGICKDDQPFIFNHFFKCDKSRNSSSKGSGLGLAICKQIVDSHEGKISVDCTMKVGCLFKIELPRRKENNAANSIQVN